MQAVAELLAEAGVAHAQPRALLAPAGADASIVAPLHRLMVHLMVHVHDANLDAYLARNQELSGGEANLVAVLAIEGRTNGFDHVRACVHLRSAAPCRPDRIV